MADREELLMSTPLTLPCGSVLSNRLAKAAMSEGFADPWGRPGIELQNLYEIWGSFGAGMLLTGNVMVDDCHLETAGNMRLENYFQDEEMRQCYKALAEKSQKNGSATWLQLSHAGRQTQVEVNKTPKGPSDIPCKAKSHIKESKPTPMTIEDIDETVQKFANAARATKDAGFKGLQIHAAHGYLLSSFLNPLANNRDDEFGGSLNNRARFLLMTVQAVREQVGPRFPVGVKLNSADFQEGGSTVEDAIEVAKLLDQAGVDLIEISGGNYENMVMVLGREEDNKPKSTIEREAYYLEYANRVGGVLTRTKLMVTGGFRRKDTIEYALKEASVSIVGLGRPFFYTNRLCTKMIKGEIDTFPNYERDLAQIPWLLSPVTLLMNKYVLAKIISFKWADNFKYLIKGEDMDETGKSISLMDRWWPKTRDEAVLKLQGVSSVGTVHNCPPSNRKPLMLAAGVLCVGILYHKLRQR
uniref:NADH:flavin oxidoreductase/NADH oxidase N-terminal domain-containing protein n=1 Tax=Aplanochytrium stocchinoi TaxID=215587 RepID=A0A6S8FE46_9STRA|mmetsp:Transcript_25426/g.31166  ORF Transcript_25426/g.31166 Transcript_25426/m.31166 type:complete len:470 (-) Transcript_25426:1183-2592(-)